MEKDIILEFRIWNLESGMGILNQEFGIYFPNFLILNSYSKF